LNQQTHASRKHQNLASCSIAQKKFKIIMTQNSKPLRIGYVIFALGALFYAYEYFLRIAPSVMHTQIVQAFHLRCPPWKAKGRGG